MEVLNQWQRNNCGVWATMGILIKYWIQFDLATFQDVKAISINVIEKLFKDSGLIDKFIPILTPTIVDMWLKKWEWLLTKTSKWNFNNPPNVTFDWTSIHFFIICEDCWDKWKCLNSWGKEWGEGGFFYINKSDFKYLFIPRRVITK